MEHQISALGLILVLLVLVIIIIAIFSLPKSKRTNSDLRLFKAFQERVQINCDVIDCWRDNYIIGLDSSRQIVAYSNKKENFEEIYGLSNYKAVLIQKVVEGDDIKKSKSSTTHNLILRLIPSHPNIPEARLEFYNRSYFSSLDKEIELLEKWKNIISSNFK